MPLGKSDAPANMANQPPAQAVPTPATEPEPKPRKRGRPKGSGAAPQVVAVTEAFAKGNDVYPKGQLFDAAHPLVKQHPEYFGPVAIVSERRTRTTTATPEG